MLELPCEVRLQLRSNIPLPSLVAVAVSVAVMQGPVFPLARRSPSPYPSWRRIPTHPPGRLVVATAVVERPPEPDNAATGPKSARPLKSDNANIGWAALPASRITRDGYETRPDIATAPDVALSFGEPFTHVTASGTRCIRPRSRSAASRCLASRGAPLSHGAPVSARESR